MSAFKSAPTQSAPRLRQLRPAAGPRGEGKGADAGGLGHLNVFHGVSDVAAFVAGDPQGRQHGLHRLRRRLGVRDFVKKEGGLEKLGQVRREHALVQEAEGVRQNRQAVFAGKCGQGGGGVRKEQPGGVGQLAIDLLSALNDLLPLRIADRPRNTAAAFARGAATCGAARFRA